MHSSVCLCCKCMHTFFRLKFWGKGFSHLMATSYYLSMKIGTKYESFQEKKYESDDREGRV